MFTDDDSPFTEVKGRRAAKSSKAKAKSPVTHPSMLSGKHPSGTGGKSSPHNSETERSSVSKEHNKSRHTNNNYTTSGGSIANRVTNSPDALPRPGLHPNVTNRTFLKSDDGVFEGVRTKYVRAKSPAGLKASIPSPAQHGTNDTFDGDNASTAASITSLQRNEATTKCVRLRELLDELKGVLELVTAQQELLAIPETREEINNLLYEYYSTSGSLHKIRDELDSRFIAGLISRIDHGFEHVVLDVEKLLRGIDAMSEIEANDNVDLLKADTKVGSFPPTIIETGQLDDTVEYPSDGFISGLDIFRGRPVVIKPGRNEKEYRCGVITDAYPINTKKRDLDHKNFMVRVRVIDSKDEYITMPIERVYLPSPRHEVNFFQETTHGQELLKYGRDIWMKQDTPLEAHLHIIGTLPGSLSVAPIDLLQQFAIEFDHDWYHHSFFTRQTKIDGDTHAAARADPDAHTNSILSGHSKKESSSDTNFFTPRNSPPGDSVRFQRFSAAAANIGHPTGSGFGRPGLGSYHASRRGQPPSVQHGTSPLGMRLSASDRLQGAAFGGHNKPLETGSLTTPVKSLSKLRLDQIPAALNKILPMESDSASETKRLYESTGFYLSAALHCPSVLPSFDNTMGVDFKTALLPPPEPVDRHNEALGLYHYIAQAVAMMLQSKVKPHKAPNSHAAITSVACMTSSTADGFKMLEAVLAANIIQNGAMIDDDFNDQIRTYEAAPGTDRLGVETAIMRILNEAASNGCAVAPLVVLKYFLRVLSKSIRIGPYLAKISTDLDRHIRSKTSDPFTDEYGQPHSLRSINTMLDRLGVDTVINGTNTRSMPTIASATAAPCSDLLDNLTDDIGKSITEELCELDDSTFHEVFANLQHVLGDNSSFLPKIKALQAKYCDCCNRKGHVSDQCHARGINFLPPTMQKKVRQFNLLHGDNPKIPPKDFLRAPPGDPAPSPKSDKIKFAPSTKPAIKSMQATAAELTVLCPDITEMQFDLDAYTDALLSAPLSNGNGNGSSLESPSTSVPLLAGSTFTAGTPEETTPEPAPAIKAMASTSNASDEPQQSTVEISDHNTFGFDNLQVNC